ncbi:hypothetical protein PR202_ga11306 [Eleusine coracana subsp. coracana]|uniref:Uncharacterized protein n=1 Tax=Eleusine coracana subsp. coracana TaxID=191504 RepID=A0AAV5C8N1_ELECO|nr:hypothetical protein PR202_ga11306 [Eleusine coracana subsp. coracana]
MPWKVMMSTDRTCSTGFRLALAKFVPRLVEAFTKIGADGCEQFHRVLLLSLHGGVTSGHGPPPAGHCS